MSGYYWFVDKVRYEVTDDEIHDCPAPGEETVTPKRGAARQHYYLDRPKQIADVTP